MLRPRHTLSKTPMLPSALERAPRLLKSKKPTMLSQRSIIRIRTKSRQPKIASATLKARTKRFLIQKRKKPTTHMARQRLTRAVASIRMLALRVVIRLQVDLGASVGSKAPKGLVEKVSTSKIYSAHSQVVAGVGEDLEVDRHFSKKVYWSEKTLRSKPISPSWMRRRALARTFTSRHSCSVSPVTAED